MMETKQMRGKDKKDEVIDISEFLKISFPYFLERPRRDGVLVAAENAGNHPWNSGSADFCLYLQEEAPKFGIGYGRLSEEVFHQGLKRLKRE